MIYVVFNLKLKSKAQNESPTNLKFRINEVSLSASVIVTLCWH